MMTATLPTRAPEPNWSAAGVVVTVDRPKVVAPTVAAAITVPVVATTSLPAVASEPRTLLGPRGYALAHAGLYAASRIVGVVGFALMPALMMWPEHLPSLVTPALGGITASLFLDDLARKPLPGELAAQRNASS